MSSDPGAYELVALADLPAFHNPARCDLRDRWRAEYERQRHVLGSRSSGQTSEEKLVGVEARRIAMRTLVADMRSGEITKCFRHRDGTDIVDASATAWEVVQSAGVLDRGMTDTWVCSEVAGRRYPPELTAQQELAASLIRDPITWTPGEAMLANGQHRVCQALLAEADRLVVRVR